MTALYKVDSTKRTFAEHWRIQWPNVGGFVIVAVSKLLGVPRPCTFGIRRPDALVLHKPTSVPRPVRESFADAIAACEERGLIFQFYSSCDAVIGARIKAYSAAMLDQEGHVWATAITTAPLRGSSGRAGRAKFSCFSRLPDSTYVVTTDHLWRITPHPGDLVEYVVGAPPDVIVARHYRRIDEPALPVLSVGEDELADLLLSREQRYVDHQVRRGVFVPMTQEEIDRLTARTTLVLASERRTEGPERESPDHDDRVG